MDSSVAHSEIAEARRLHKDGQCECAAQKLIALAQAGSIDAMIELAHMARDQNRRSESDGWVESAEAALKPEDLDGRISLNGAYSLGLGRGEREILECNALRHLEYVASAGNAAAQESLALQFLYGLNGCKKDVSQFEYWIDRAIATGSPRAAYLRADHLYKERRQVPPAIVSILEAVRSKNKVVDKLLDAISKRADTKVPSK